MIRLALVATALTGCQMSAECDPSVEDCGQSTSGSVYTGDLGIAQIAWSCCDPDLQEDCSDGGLYWYDLITDGAASGATLTVAQGSTSSGHSESHQLPIHDSDPAGWWQDRYLELPIVDTSDCAGLSSCEDRQKANENTLFPCSLTYTGGLMTWTIRLYQDPDPDPVACAVWGQDPGSAGECEIWDLGA